MGDCELHSIQIGDDKNQAYQIKDGVDVDIVVCIDMHYFEKHQPIQRNRGK